SCGSGSRQKPSEFSQVAGIPHRNKVIPGRHLHLGSRIEEHLTAGLTKRQNHYAGFVLDIDVRQSAPGKCALTGDLHLFDLHIHALLLGEIQKLQYMRLQHGSRHVMPSRSVWSEYEVGAGPPHLLLGGLLSDAHRKLQVWIERLGAQNDEWVVGVRRECRDQ